VCRAQVVCFDVDSTVTKMEGIDELAKVAGVHNVVQNLTSGVYSVRVVHTRRPARARILRNKK
jgi:phosphoserine phosphatase